MANGKLFCITVLLTTALVLVFMPIRAYSGEKPAPLKPGHGLDVEILKKIDAVIHKLDHPDSASGNASVVKPKPGESEEDYMKRRNAALARRYSIRDAALEIGNLVTDPAPYMIYKINNMRHRLKRVQLLKILSDGNMPGGRKTILRLLDEGNADVKIDILRRMNFKFTENELVDRVLPMILDADASVREAARRALFAKRHAFKKKKLHTLLVGVMLKNRGDRAAQADMVTLISWLQDPNALPLLISKLNSFDSKLRMATIKALALFKDDRARQGIEKALLDSSDAESRILAASLLGNIGDPASIPPLIKALEDSEKSVVGRAVRSLEKITGKSLGANAEKWKVWWRDEGRTSIPVPEDRLPDVDIAPSYDTPYGSTRDYSGDYGPDAAAPLRKDQESESGSALPVIIIMVVVFAGAALLLVFMGKKPPPGRKAASKKSGRRQQVKKKSERPKIVDIGEFPDI